jgi:hypothetical protein
MTEGMKYTPHSFGEVLRRQVETQADFTYTIHGGVIAIVDLDLGNCSVTNDVENVLRKIEHFHQGSIVGFRIMYRDSAGIWDGIDWNGQLASFFALRETEEVKARKKLLERGRR